MYDQSVLRLAMNLLQSPEDARDVYQEAFLRVFRNLHAFRFDCSFHTWLYRIVTNICLDQLRKAEGAKRGIGRGGNVGRNHRPHGVLRRGCAEADPERTMWNRQLRQRIENALKDLTRGSGWPSSCAHYQGLRLRNIGEMLGTTEEAAKNCLFRATQKMRVVLGDFGMTCDSVAKLIPLYFYGELPPMRKIAWRRTCTSVRVYPRTGIG